MKREHSSLPLNILLQKHLKGSLVFHSFNESCIDGRMGYCSRVYSGSGKEATEVKSKVVSRAVAVGPIPEVDLPSQSACTI